MFLPGKYLSFHLKSGYDLYLNNIIVGAFIFIWIWMLSWYSLNQKKDKMAHLAVCALLMTLGIWCCNHICHISWLWAAAVTILIGIGKEIWDSFQINNKFDWADLEADLISVICVGMAYWFTLT